MPAVVVSSSSLAREFLLEHDKDFADRPSMEFSRRMSYGPDNGVILAPYGARWREMRRICTLHLLSSRRLQQLEHIRKEEIQVLLRDIKQQQSQLPINLCENLRALASNVIGRMVLSKRLSEGRIKGGTSLQDLMHEMNLAFTTPLIGDFIPYLGWLDLKAKRFMDDLQFRVDKYLEQLLTERQQEIDENPREAPRDMLDMLLWKNITNDGKALDKAAVKGLVMDMFGAAIDTSSITSEWAMAELLGNPRCLKKLQNELDDRLGGVRDMAEESDLPGLPYLNSVIKETLRLHPPGPLLLPHASKQKCKVAGYTFPKNTQLFVNVWAIGRDPKVWEKPQEFWPERFEGKDMDVRGQHFELLPFGSGRRSCPGMALGLAMVMSTVSSLVHSFDWELPTGLWEVDMTERKGPIACKAMPLLAIPKPRLPLNGS